MQIKKIVGVWGDNHKKGLKKNEKGKRKNNSFQMYSIKKCV